MNRSPYFALALILAATPAAAHLDPAAHGSFAAGITHPVLGADHVLAMLSVGLWAALLRGRALWALPLAFVGAMTAGFALSLGGWALPMVEPVILASVIVLGVLVALAAQVALPVALVIAASFGAFHGHAHGAEMGAAGALAYLAGFTVATAALHASGAALGLWLARFGHAGLARTAGGLVAVSGAALAMGV